MARQRGRVGRWVERAALGAIMSAVAFVVERRLLKVIRKRGEEPPGADDASTASLSTAKQVNQ